MSRYLPVLLMGMILAGGHLVSAQVTTATISGVVQDSSGAVIPGVSIAVKNIDTGVSRTITTDEGGRYVVPDLSLGNYEVEAQLPGFQTEVRSGITLTVGRSAVVNFGLKVGQLSDKVTITGEAPLVELNTATLSSLVDERTIRDLPLNGRSYDKLALLQPGTVIMGAGQAAAFDYGTGQRFSVTGSRPYANSFMLDGTDINDHANATPGGAAGTNLGVDGIREFQIITNQSSAEYGRSTGGVISAVTRSGTNNLHGSAFEFIRNSALDSPGYFDRGVVPPFRRNQFGGALGGPIQKDKTFFFGTYEGLRQSLGTTRFGTVPTALARQGILPNQTVQVASSVKPYLALYPLPNGQDYGDGTAAWIAAPSVVSNEDYFMMRIDRQISDKMSIFGRYSYDADTRVIPYFGNLPVFDEHDIARRQYSTFQVSNILRPNLVNSLRFAYNRTYQLFDDLPTKPLAPDLSFIPGKQFGTIQIGVNTGGGARPLSSLGVDAGAPRDYKYNMIQVGDDLTFNTGKHTLKMGTDIRRLRDNAITDSNGRGTYTFDDFVSFLRGIPSADTGFQAPRLGSSSYRGFRETIAGTYMQDDFKVTQRLTLNLGLRWEVMRDPREVNGKMSRLLSPLDSQLMLTDRYFSVGKKDFQPRVGLAWQLNGSGTTVLRAGFGILHDHIMPNAYVGFASNNPPFYLSQTVISLQRQVMKDTVVEVAYLGSESHHLETSGELNTPVPILVNGQHAFPATGVVQNLRANQNFASIQSYWFGSNANYNALQVTFKRRSSSGLQYQAFYTYSRSMDEKSLISGGESHLEGVTTLDYLDLRRDYARSSYDARQSFVATATYPFPFRFQQKALELILAGWTANGITTLRAGAPFTPTVGFNRSRNGDRWSPDRPNLNPGFSSDPTHGVTAGCAGVPAGQTLGTPQLFYDPCAFSLPAPGTYGNLGRNTVTGPGLTNVDVSLEKTFKPREPMSVQFRTEVFNILNNSNFSIPGYALFQGNGDRIGSAGHITALTTQPRLIQFALKILF